MSTLSKNISTSCERIIIGLLIAAVLVIPLFFDIRLYSVFDLSKVTALYLITIAVLGIWLILLAFGHNFKFSHVPINIPILAYIAIFVISSITSINPIMSLFGTYKRFEGLTATFCYIFLFYATVNFITTKKRVYLLTISIVSCATISSIYGIIQHLGLDVFKWSSEGPRIFSTFGNPVFFSAQLVITLPLAVALFFSNSLQQKESISEKLPGIASSNQITPLGPPLRRGEREVSFGYGFAAWIFLIVSLIIYTTFWYTNTRACFVALIGGFTPYLFFIFKRITTERYKFIVLVVSFTLIGVFFNLKHENSIVKRFTERFADEIKTSDTTSVSTINKEWLDGLSISEQTQFHKRPWLANKLPVSESSFSRIFQYLAAIEIIKDYPALGIGPDTIGIVYQKNLAKVFSSIESDKGFPFPRQDRIHNDILDIAATRGLFGLGTYIWLLVAFGMYVGKNYKKLSNQNKILILGLSAGILCYLIQNEFSFGNTPIVTLFWVMMGLCISLIRVNEPEGVLSREDNGLKVKAGGWEGKKTGGSQPHKFPASQVPVFYKWLGCGIGLVAMGFATVFVLRFHRADAYFEYGRRILDYERQNLDNTTEKGLYFIKYAIRLNPYETFYRDELCRTYIQKALKTKDEAWVQKAYIEANNSLKLIPEHYMGFFHLGMIYQMLADHFGRNTYELAVDSYKKAIDSDPFQAPFHSNLAALYINKGNLDQAIEELLRAYLIRPEELNHVDRLANAYLQKGDLEKALYFSRKTVKLNPSESGYYNNLGAILSKMGKYEESIEAFKKAIQINPKDQIYLENLTKLYLSVGKYDDLIPYYKKLIDLNPSVADYHNNLGAIYRRKNQPEDAVPLFLKAVELKPDSPVYTHNLASTYVDLGKTADAENILQTFSKTYPDHNYINIYLLLANLYSKNTNWEKVVLECEQAIKIDGKAIPAYRMLATAYYTLHKYELAEKVLRQVIGLDPNDQGSKDMLAKISNEIRR